MPGRPVVPPLRAPWVDAVGDPFLPKGLGHHPRLPDVFPLTLTRREQNEALPQCIELRPLESGQERERRREEKVVAELVVKEPLQSVSPAHPDRSAEHVWIAAQHGDRVERT